jgi:hypothetical protein
MGLKYNKYATATDTEMCVGRLNDYNNTKNSDYVSCYTSVTRNPEKGNTFWLCG